MISAAEFLKFMKTRRSIPNEMVVEEIIGDPDRFGVPKSRSHIENLVRTTRKDIKGTEAGL